MNVTIGNKPCDAVTVIAPDTLTSFTCYAPSEPGVEDVQLRVRVDSGGSATTRFLYEPPHIAFVSPNPCQSNASCSVTITGTNLGLATAPSTLVFIGELCLERNRCVGTAYRSSLSSLNLTLAVLGCRETGNMRCVQLSIVNPGEATCRSPSMPVGRHAVVVSRNGQNSSGSVTMDRLCGAAQFAFPGQYCDACPRVCTVITGSLCGLCIFISGKTVLVSLTVCELPLGGALDFRRGLPCR
jgi:hypothetical protein